MYSMLSLDLFPLNILILILYNISTEYNIFIINTFFCFESTIKLYDYLAVTISI